MKFDLKKVFKEDNKKFYSERIPYNRKVETIRTILLYLQEQNKDLLFPTIFQGTISENIYPKNNIKYFEDCEITKNRFLGYKIPFEIFLEEDFDYKSCVEFLGNVYFGNKSFPIRISNNFYSELKCFYKYHIIFSKNEDDNSIICFDKAKNKFFNI